MGFLSERSLFDFGMAISTAVLIAVTIKSAYLSRSLVYLSPEKFAEPKAASSVDSNTSLSVKVKLLLAFFEHSTRCVFLGAAKKF